MRRGDSRLLPLWKQAIGNPKTEFDSRADLVRSLWSCHTPEAEQILLGLLRDRFVPVRVAAAETLKHFQSQEAADALVVALERDDWEVQMAASRSLAWFPDPEIDGGLRAFLSGPDWRTRAAAVLTLGRRRGPGTVEETSKCVEDRSVCRYALEALGLHATPEATKRLLSLLASSDDPNVLCFGMETVARFGIREAGPVLQKLLKDDSQEISRAARGALFELHFKGLGQTTQ